MATKPRKAAPPPPVDPLPSQDAPPAPLPPLDPLQRYTVVEAARYLRTSRAYVFQLIQRNELKTFRDGKMRYVPGSEIVRRSAAPQTAI